MRRRLSDQLEAGRATRGDFATNRSYGPNGLFLVTGPTGDLLRIIASSADFEPHVAQGWEHVSVSLEYRVPLWVEMCFVKSLFWEDEECVVQFHPPRSLYYNHHPHMLHLWRDTNEDHELPPRNLL